MSKPTPIGSIPLEVGLAYIERMEQRQFQRFMSETLTRNPDGTTTIKRPVRYSHIGWDLAKSAPPILEDW